MGVSQSETEYFQLHAQTFSNLSRCLFLSFCVRLRYELSMELVLNPRPLL
jgi:hypothetical protein